MERRGRRGGETMTKPRAPHHDSSGAATSGAGTRRPQGKGSGPEARRESGRIILVGLAPPKLGEPSPLAVADWTGTQAHYTSFGGRIASMAGLSPDEYHEAIDRRYTVAHPIGQAGRKVRGECTEGAERIIDTIQPGAQIVLCGKLVAAGFGMKFERWHEWVACGYAPRCRIAAVPLPSHSANWYHDPRNRSEAVRFWRALVAERRLAA